MRHLACALLAATCLAACSNSPDAVIGPHGMKLYKPGDDKADAPAGSHLTYHGGVVIPNARVLPVYWGDDVQNTQQFDSFYAAITQSAYMDWLSEYDTEQQHIGRGSFGGSIHDSAPYPTFQPFDLGGGGSFDGGGTSSDGGAIAIDGGPLDPIDAGGAGGFDGGVAPSFDGGVAPSFDGGVAPSFDGGVAPTVQLTIPAIQAELARLIHAGQLPAEDGNNLYFVHLPARVLVVDPVLGNSCDTYCAFHDSFELDGRTTFYAVMPECGTGCASAGQDAFQGMTVSASHELIEAVTDANVGPWVASSLHDTKSLAWNDDNNGEIGDICAWQTTATIAGFTVQTEWSNAHRACIATSPDVSGQGGDFSLATDQPTRTVAHGNATSFLLSALTKGGAVGKIELHVSRAPMGVDTSLSSPVIPAGDDSTLKVQVAASVAPGTYAITVEANAHSATGTPIKKELTLTLVVVDHVDADFAIGFEQSAASVVAGSQVTFHLFTQAVVGTTQLTLAVSGLPAGVTGRFDRPTINVGDDAYLTIAVDAGTPAGALGFAVTAMGDVAKHSVMGQLSVTAPPGGGGGDFVVAIAPLDRSVGIGGTTTFMIITAANGNLTAPIVLSASGLPAGAFASFDPPVIQANQSSTMTISASGATPPGAVAVTLRAVAGALEHDSQMILRVLSPGPADPRRAEDRSP